ncbi:ring-cleaving dioxygenase [Alicyclobacillus fastidiosus]|uniref:Ring-cleaving dioxygenase n=1 Tax=Alicyclobacillus fastidiosus TaxID=392011 RepID=A0ABY6ZBR4_9BACL|nr:ring-cleaving dioxygenase [Alicyclobacillus fastidiosus]WAH40343.1 ring-cleaving dioxygenase [Alicyclobacillus fastidiosus]GMA61727.1 glyoxalase [Alicyclobacillus fastidiosus]
MELMGIHHLTAVSSRIRENYQFYTTVMGLRLVKRSVNQDDVSAYHLFYSGDRRGVPGNDLTFFDWDIPREERGTRSITRTYLRVHGESALSWWADWLRDKGVKQNPIENIDGRATLLFEDPEGQRLALVDDGGRGDAHEAWERSVVPAENQIRGQGPIMISVPELRYTDMVLTTVMSMRQVRQYAHPENAKHTVYVYEMGPGGPHAELHVAVQPELPVAQLGAGGVHHVAFRTPNETEYHEWIQRIQSYRIPNSGEVDRYWFCSLYFREPNGILFEIATDEPGFAVDEDPESLGEKIVLAPFLEPRRAEIVANLKPLD